jgi:hypothetical protein
MKAHLDSHVSFCVCRLAVILDLSRNLQILGSIPSGLFSLSRLMELRLNSNSLSGTLMEDMSQLSNIGMLRLSLEF